MKCFKNDKRSIYDWAKNDTMLTLGERCTDHVGDVLVLESDLALNKHICGASREGAALNNRLPVTGAKPAHATRSCLIMTALH